MLAATGGGRATVLQGGGCNAVNGAPCTKHTFQNGSFGRESSCVFSCATQCFAARRKSHPKGIVLLDHGCTDFIRGICVGEKGTPRCTHQCEPELRAGYSLRLGGVGVWGCWGRERESEHLAFQYNRVAKEEVDCKGG
jgi:hypothetical protein